MMPERFPPLCILAAGRSSRMGTPKGLLDANGIPFLAYQLARFRELGGVEAVVVHGDGAAGYEDVLSGLSGPEWEGLHIFTARNEDPERGSFSSLQVGLKALGKHPEGVFVLPVDVPCPKKEVFDALVEESHGGSRRDVCLPEYKGQGGHPVWISELFAGRLLALPSEGETARLDHQIAALPPIRQARVEVSDSSVTRNLNLPSDWQEFKSRDLDGGAI